MSDKRIIVNASLSCIDLYHLKDQIEEINQSSIDGLHYDVVDGEFNKCFIFGDLMLEKIRLITNKPICVHLAVNQVEKYIEPMARAGADYIAVHYETHCDFKEVFKKIYSFGAKPVLAFRSETDVPNDFEDLAKQVEWILKLTVNPGFSGQRIQRQALEHIKEMSLRLSKAKIIKGIEADGNVNAETISEIVSAGATILTGGTSGLFNSSSTIEKNCQIMKKVAYEK